MKTIGLVFSTLLTIALGATSAFAANVYDTLKADPQFSMLSQIIDASDIKFRYVEGTITVFAPTDEALKRQPSGVDDMMTASNPTVKENARALLLYQIIKGRHTPETLSGTVTEVSTLQRNKVRIDGTQTPIRYGGQFGANIAGAAIEASNGVIIPVDALPIHFFTEMDPPEDQTEASGALN